MGSDELVIRGGGMTAVATDSLLEAGRILEAFERVLHADRAALHRRIALVDPDPVDFFHRGAVPGEDVAARLATLGGEAGTLAGRLSSAAERYGQVERIAQDLARHAAAGGAAFAGSMLTTAPGPLLAGAGLLLMVAPVVEIAVLVKLVAPGWARAAERRLERGGIARILCTTGFVALLRLAVSSLDNAVLGALHVPQPLAASLDDDATGLFGLVGVARAFLGMTMIFGLLQETAVRTRQAGAFTDTPPAGFEDLAKRIPPAVPGGPQVRIERYTDSGATRWIVYVGGTVDLGLRSGSEPYDTTSNVHAVARCGAAAVRMTLQAMHQAGVAAQDEVTFIGYSQGGLAANAVALHGDYPNAAVVTFGSPTGGVVLPRSIPNIAVEIDEDLVPALGGPSADKAHGGLRRTVVNRSIYAEQPPPTDRGPLPAHDLAGYRETARLMDGSTDPRFSALRDRVAVATGGGAAAAAATLWHGERVPDRAPGGAGEPGGRGESDRRGRAG